MINHFSGSLKQVTSALIFLTVISLFFPNVTALGEIKLEVIVGSIALASIIMQMVCMHKQRPGYILPFAVMMLPVLFVGAFHGYLYEGLVFLALLGWGIANNEMPLRIFDISYHVLFLMLISLIVVGVMMTWDSHFVRNFNYPSSLYESTVLSTPNRLASLSIILASYFLYLYLSVRISRTVYVGYFILMLTVVAVVCESRLATVAILFQIPYVIYAKSSSKTTATKVLISFAVMIPALYFSYHMNPRLENIQNVFQDVVHAAEAEDISDVGKRAKVIVSTYQALEDRPFTGYGGDGSLEKFKQLGAVYEAEQGLKTLSVHGSLAKVSMTGGIIAGLCFFGSIVMLFKIFLTARNVNPPAAFAALFLVTSGFLVQFGGDFYLKPMFIIAIGFYLSLLKRTDTSDIQSEENNNTIYSSLSLEGVDHKAYV